MQIKFYDRLTVRLTSTLILSSLAAFAITGCDFHQYVSLQTRLQQQFKQNYSGRFNKAIEYIKKGDCADAWDVVWNWARTGDREASAFLAEAVFGGLTPAGERDLSRRQQVMHFLNLAVHGLDARLPTELSHLASEYPLGFRITKLVSETYSKSVSDAISECFLKKSSDECRSIAVSNGIILPFYQYVSLVERNTKLRGRSLGCRILLGSTSLID